MFGNLLSHATRLRPGVSTAGLSDRTTELRADLLMEALRERARVFANVQLLDAAPVLAILAATLLEVTRFSDVRAIPFAIAGALLLMPVAPWLGCAAAAALPLTVGNSDWAILLGVYAAVYVCRRRVEGTLSWTASVVAIVVTAGTNASFVVGFARPYGDNQPIAAVLGILGGIAAAELARSITARQALEDEARALRDQAREREEHAAWLDQRTRLARELHDVVGHHVTAMVVQAEAGLARGDAQATTSLHKIADLGRSALGDLDAMVHALREPGESVAWTSTPRIVDLPRLADPLEAAGVSVEVLVLVQDAITLDDAQELTVYRIVQESLTNVLRHSGARQAWVDVRDDGEHLHVRVSDDGAGPPAGGTHGSGLKGIAERVTAMNGVWTLSRRPGGGTSVDVLLPVVPASGARHP